MEGLIPFVYRAIMDYKNGGRQGPGMMNYSCMSNESPSASYMRLPGDSGRFEASDIQLFRPDHGFSTSSSPSAASAASKRMASAAGVQPCSWISSRAVKK